MPVGASDSTLIVHGQRSANRIHRLHKGGTGILKIGKALGIGTGTVQRVLME
jgi:hypothetical protein